MLALHGATLSCNVTLCICVGVVAGGAVSDVEVNLSHMTGIGLGQSVAAQRLIGWQTGSALLENFLGCRVEAFNSKRSHLHHGMA